MGIVELNIYRNFTTIKLMKNLSRHCYLDTFFLRKFYFVNTSRNYHDNKRNQQLS